MKKLIAIIILFCFIPLYCFPQELNIIDVVNEQDDLLTQLENEFASLNMMINMLKDDNAHLKLDNEELQKYIDLCNEKIKQLLFNIEDMKKALNSNKEDTSVVITILGDMQEELEKHQEYINSIQHKLDLSYKVTNIIIPLTCLPIAIDGIYNYSQGNIKNGNNLMIAFGITLISAELVWNGGHLILKLW